MWFLGNNFEWMFLSFLTWISERLFSSFSHGRDGQQWVAFSTYLKELQLLLQILSKIRTRELPETFRGQILNCHFGWLRSWRGQCFGQRWWSWTQIEIWNYIIFGAFIVIDFAAVTTIVLYYIGCKLPQFRMSNFQCDKAVSHWPAAVIHFHFL